MGNQNTNSFKQNTRKDSQSIQLSDNIKPQGTLTRQSIKNLSNQQLILFKVVSSSNFVLFKLLSKSIDLSVLDRYRTSLLHVASRSGSYEMVKQLIKKGCQINLRDIGKQTPLHIAALFQRREIVQKLIFKGGDAYLNDIQGRKAYDIIKSIAKQDQIYSNSKHIDNFTMNDLRNSDNSTQHIDENNQIKRTRKISFNQSNIKEDMMNHRDQVLKLCKDRHYSKSNKKQSYLTKINLLKALASQCGQSAIIYLLNSQQTSYSDYFIKNKQNLKYVLLNCLTCLPVPALFYTSIKVIKKLLIGQKDLIKVVKILVDSIYLLKDPFKIHILCWLVVKVIFEESNSLIQEIDAYHNALFIIIWSRLSFQSLEKYSPKVLLTKYLSTLSYSQDKVKQVIQQCKKQIILQSKPNNGFIQKETSYLGVQGKLIKVLQQGLLFIQEYKILVMVSIPSENLYDIFQIDKYYGTIIKLQDTYQLNPQILK